MNGMTSVLSMGLFRKNVGDSRRHAPLKSRAPNWTRHGTAHLCHVVADARNRPGLKRIYQLAETRAELDEIRHAPFALELKQLFIDHVFVPSLPEPVEGIVEDLLSTNDAGLYPHPTHRTTLIQKWTRLLSLYTVSCKNFETSRQSDAEAFLSFTREDDSLCYM